MGASTLSSQFSRFSGMGAGGEQFPDPFLDVSSLAVPGTMRSALYWCLPPGAEIETANFSTKLVEDVVAGDLVRNKLGGVGEVSKTSKTKHVGDLVSIRYGGYGGTFPHRMTPDHKVWVYSQGKFSRKAAKEVEEGDEVATPLPVVTSSVEPRFGGWLLGMYVAEGCFVSSGWRRLGVRFCLGEGDEGSGVLAKLLGELKAATDLPQAVVTPPSRPDARLVTSHDPELPDWCHAYAGQNATAKKLTAAVLMHGEQFLLEFIAGWIDGDGWAANGGLCGCTASKALALQVVRLANACGLLPSIRLVDNNKGFGVEGSLAWQVYFGRVDVERLRPYCVKAAQVGQAKSAARPGYRIEGQYVVRPVLSVGAEAYDGFVYNFKVEGDHSYIADGVTTSNCEYIYSMFGTYRMAMDRIVSYFLTSIELADVSEDEKEKWEDFLNNTLNLLGVVQDLLRDRMAYGNAFASVVVPFKRFLGCPNKKCGSHWPLDVVYENQAFKFTWQMPEFVATCPICKTRGSFLVDDKPDDEEKKIKIVRWSPHEIEILHDPYTHDCAYLWRIPDDYKRLVRQGKLFHLQRVPKQVLKAIQHNQVFRFNEDTIYHMKEPTLAGILNRGWGIPRIIQNFRQIWYVQVLHRFNEAIALDYVIPFRLITPGQRQGAGGSTGQAIDPLMTFNGGDFRNNVKRMIRERRRDPASWQVLPFPVNYQMLGAEANQLAPRDLMDQGTEMLLNDAGTPVELYKGTLQLQTAPVALRLFESTWHHMVHDANDFISWVVDQVSQILSWESVAATMKKVTIADDLQKQMAILQLMTSQQVSGTTGLGMMGLNWPQEQKQMADEARQQAEIQSRTQEEMQQAGFAQQMAKGQGGDPSQGGGGGGAPPQGGGGGGGGDPSQGGAQGSPMQGPVSQYIQSMSPQASVTPQDMMSAADSIAQQLLGQPDGVKDSELRKLKTANQALHALVIARIDQIRSDTKSQAGNQAMAQMQQGGAAGGGGGGQAPGG